MRSFLKMKPSLHPVKHHLSSSIVSWIEDEDSMAGSSHFTDSEMSEDGYSHSNSYLSRNLHDMHISVRLIEEFMELAKENTSSNLETCGILGASLKDGIYYVTTLVIPKQETTAHSCQASNEEEIHATLAGLSLIPVGWIHTHPSQTCFLSSIDLHTQYSYQVMLPKAVAIVNAPTDQTRQVICRDFLCILHYGIFRLTDPGGMAVLRECKESGFHQHPQTLDGSSIYESCGHVYFKPNLRFEIVDLRTS
ncbi:AMSH-like ubiquitin thioesterase 2 isoform X1 [Carex littledalei]|uniref:AMSH-like ubiquitin thioesterase 2 isoform X1 n=1 Tax=Carex littledalei TaxID=544730 RepID=A0A833VNR8_9POAL|nr:AMSH-like ubiquitin thioesterase 2 isoform X1 [Carex littledalei]